MLFYQLTVQYEWKNKKSFREEEKKERKEKLRKILKKTNHHVKNASLEEPVFVYCTLTENKIGVITSLPDSHRETPDHISGRILAELSEKEGALRYKCSGFREITLLEIKKYLDRAEENDLIAAYRRIPFDDIYGNPWFSVKEQMISKKKTTKTAAFRKADHLLADQTLREELDRIFAKENRTIALAHPVHYIIRADKRESAEQIIDLLTHALYSRGRLRGQRIHYVSRIKRRCYDEDQLTNLFKWSKGTAIAIETAGESNNDTRFANGYEQVIDEFEKLIRETENQTLVFFVELSDCPGFGRSLLERLQPDMSFLEIREGMGTKEQAEQYLKQMIADSEYRFLKPKNLEGYLPPHGNCHLSDIYEAFDAWKKDMLRHEVYPAYENCKIMEWTQSSGGAAASVRLEQMIGLHEVKALVKQMVASYRVMRLREVKGLSVHAPARHMIFTGNPGSAKTTVARLLAEVFADEGIMKKKNLVECGRGDLVGKYVGWTAKIVEKKFQEACGGMLFIDEAYALVEEKGLYGDEAIHTIVQQMENLRDEVIVVFAGYREKMKEFLSRNEGLRSRIAFHLDFPDYNADELAEILKLMADNHGFVLSEDAVAYGRQLFEMAARREDFGNGRFVRNVFEQAQMRQAERLIAKYRKRSIPTHALKQMEEEDFRIQLPCADENRRVIGF